MKITFVCIGNDEFEHIQVLLPQLKDLADEVVYVDGESQDGSLQFAKDLGIRVMSRPRNINANYSRMAGFEVVTGDWIFYVDPDERFSRELIEELRLAIAQNPQLVGFKLPRKNYYFGVWLKYGGQYPDNQIRIFKKGFGHFKNKFVHERLSVDGPLGQLKTPMEHHPYLTISQFLKKLDYYSTYEANYLYRDGVRTSFSNSLRFLFFKPFNRFFRRYVVKRGFLDGIPGFFAAFFDAVGWMSRYFKLWEIEKTEKTKH